MSSTPSAPVTTSDSGIVRSTIRLLIAVATGSLLMLAGLPLAAAVRAVDSSLPTAERMSTAGVWTAPFLLKAALLVAGACLVAAGIYYLLKITERFLDDDADREAAFLDNLNPRYLDAAIVVSAALSLFLELALIRWQSTVLEFLAFYKNFSLLSCFAGLGLGYALASRNRIPLILVVPLLAWQFTFMLVIRTVPGLFYIIPFREQLTMGMETGGLARQAALLSLLCVVFLTTALTFIPVGQLCGRLMERRSKIRAYGLNLVGSVIGVLLMIGTSFLWTPPLVWFGLCFLGLLTFHVRRTASLFTGAGFAVLAAIILSWWPVDRLWNRIYSPYQLLEVGASHDSGLTLIRAAGHYYQRIHDFSRPSLAAGEQRIRDYYDLPYKVHPRLTDVAVVGSGAGNDVAAALRAGAGRVDAIEIDPAIMLVGRMSHPEKPYEDPRTHAITNDARSFLRNTDRKYDLIVYGLLDSHTLLSHGSSVRLDSFVYTVEGLREARSRLKSDGAVSLAFSLMSDEIGRKIYLMLQDAFDGRPPACVKAGYDGAVVFMASNDPNAVSPRAVLAESGFTDQTAYYANPALHASISTDDWPFFYMPRRVYPTSYLLMVVQVVLLSLLLGWNYLRAAPRFSHLSFFFLGAGFMLIETKGITEIGLTFGNTWHVIGVVIAGILVMAFLGNCAVAWLNIKRPFIPYLLLWAAVAIGWIVARSGGFGSTPVGRLETAIVLTCPLLFSGVVFSTLLSSKGRLSGIMAMNLLGAICGGLLEYNSMYFGFQWLYLAAMVCYLLAFLSDLLFTRSPADETAMAAA